MSTPDIELGTRNVTSKRGFALVASKINSDVDKTTTIYRRFDELSARSLLYFQAELAELEEELKDNDDEDSQARDKIAVDCQRDWSVFERSAGEGVEREKRRMELVMKIREKLEKYRTVPKSQLGRLITLTDKTQTEHSRLNKHSSMPRPLPPAQ